MPMSEQKPEQNVQRRFEDTGETTYDLLDEILVVCPRCKACARVVPLEPGRKDWLAPRRLTCTQCGYSRDWAEKTLRSIRRDKSNYNDNSTVVDPFFGEALWLQIRCGKETLWAYNYRHLTLIEKYVGAQLREHHRRPTFGWQNSSLINRLPRWMSAAKHRDAILKRE